MESKVKLYTEYNIIPSELIHTFMLIPFLGKYKETSEDPDIGRFNELEAKGRDLFEIVTIPEESDYFLLPFGYSFSKNHLEIINEFLDKANKFSKKTILFYNSDDDSMITHSNAIIFRTSLNKSLKQPNEYALPGWSVDFKKYFYESSLNYLPKGEFPDISYCGYVDFIERSLTEKVKNMFLKAEKDNESKAKEIRGKACRILISNSHIKTNFIFRNGFWAAGINDKNKARLDYANSFINSTYALVARGGGNFSYRLYEVLSCGRVPVFINTDSVLPFENTIDWRNHLVWIEQKEMNNLDDDLIKFHESKSDSELLRIQKQNRVLYETKISPFGFFKELAMQLKNNML